MPPYTRTMIDLRSDTVTSPCPEMREAMAAAPVGDDQFGEDPSINELQDRMAALFGKEAALWLPTGTMANQVALRTLTRPGDDVIVSHGAHMVWSETGAGGANAGVQFTELGGGRGFVTAAEVEAAIKPRNHVILPPTTVVAVENTHNRAGGVVIDLDILSGVCATAREAGVATLLDGARVWNAATALGASVADVTAPFDLAWAAFSKGLGAPGGSIMVGPRDVIARAHRHRRMLGGAMRQVGIFAAAALHAVDHHMDGLAVDHANARAVAEILASSERIAIDPVTVQSNIVVFELVDGDSDAPAVVDRAADAGVGVFALGPTTIRAVTHRDVTPEECQEAARLLVESAEA